MSISSSTPGSDLLLEHYDHLVQDGVLLVSLGLVGSVLLSLCFQISLGLVKCVLGLLEDDLRLGLLGEGGLDLLNYHSIAYGGGSVGEDLLSLVFDLELGDFGFG